MNKLKEMLSQDFTDEALREVNISTENLSRMDKISLWADYVKKNDNWKKIHTKLINTHYKKINSHIKELCKTDIGKSEVAEALDIKDMKRYCELFIQ